jgi:peptidoglycan hydrolase-like protein with peptidoglycan-binding domain
VKWRRLWVVAALVIVIVGAGAYLALMNPFSWGKAPTATGQNTAAPASLAEVTKQTLTSQTALNGTLGYAASSNIVNQAAGTFTSLPKIGQIVKAGEALYSVDHKPVILLAGDIPAYRTLSRGMKGGDVTQLNANLVKLGYATTKQLDSNSTYFSSATRAAVKKLQEHFGLTKTGTLTLGQAVFLPTSARITKISVDLGSQAQPGAAVLAATATKRVVTLNLNAARQAQVKVGDPVTITLPDNTKTPGTVTAVGSVAAAATDDKSAPTIPVEIAPSDPTATGALDQAPVSVLITTAEAKDALVVPVTALVALAGGGYAVEVQGPDQVRTLVPVSLGLFDDAKGLVQVTGSGIVEGQKVVVPSS